MKPMERILSFLLPSVAFFLPWQTALIMREGALAGFAGVWQYGTLQVFGLDIFLASVMIAGAVFFARTQGALQIFGRPDVWCAVLLAGAAWGAVFFAPERTIALAGAARLTGVVVLYILVRTLPISVRAIALWWTAGAVIQSILAVWQFFVQEAGGNAWLGMAFHSPKAIGDAVIEQGELRWLRAYGSFPHPNILAMYLSFGLIFLFWLTARIHEKWKLYCAFLAGALLIAGLFFTFSRSGWLTLAAASVGAGFFAYRGARTREANGRFSPTTVCALGCVITAVFLLGIWHEPVSARFGAERTLGRLEQKSVNERLQGIADTLSLAPRHLEGVGLRNATRVIAEERRNQRFHFANEYQPVHVVPLLVLFEAGVVGFFAFFAFMVARVKERAPFRQLTPFDAALALALIVPLFFDHFYWTLLSGLLMWWVAWGVFKKEC